MYAYIRTRTHARMHRPIFTYASPSPQACAPTRTRARSRTPSHVHPHTRARKYVRPQVRSHQQANKMSPYCAFQRFFLFRNEARNAGCSLKIRECGKYAKMRDFPNDCWKVDTYGRVTCHQNIRATEVPGCCRVTCLLLAVIGIRPSLSQDPKNHLRYHLGGQRIVVFFWLARHL